MSFEISIARNRTRSYDILLFEEDGTTAFDVVTGDNVRVKIYRGDQATPALDLDEAATANGSVVTFTNGTNAVVLRIDQADALTLNRGVYSIEVAVVDDSDSDKIKHVETGVLNVLPAGGGAITI